MPNRATNKRPTKRRKTWNHVYRPMSRPQKDIEQTFKLKGTATLNSTAGGVISFYARLTQPDLFDGANPVQDWSNLVALYDSFRVNSVTLRYYPVAPNDPASVHTFAPVYSVLEPDSVASPSSVASAIQYDSLRCHNMFAPWKDMRIVPKQLIPLAGTGIAQGDFLDLNATQVTGCVALYGTGFSISTGYGYLVCEYSVTFKNRR